MGLKTATGNAASWFAISFHTDTVFPAFIAVARVWSVRKGRKGKEGERKRENEKKRKEKKRRRKRKAIADPKDPSSTRFNRLSPVILALDNQTVQHKVISL